MLEAKVKKKLIAIVGKSRFSDTEEQRIVYSYDGTPGFQAEPDAVIRPASTSEVQQIVRLCAEHKVPIVPRGSGTNLCAGTTPTHGGVVMLFTEMNRILEVDMDNLTMTVQPGVTTLEIVNRAESEGLFYPPDPSSMKISTIGGNINENSGGLRGLKYGVTKDYIMGLEFVLANGEVIRTGGKLAKDVAGYDLTKLMIGAEGTLGIITEATLKLVPKPEKKETMLALFPDMESSAKAVSSIIASKIIPATLEFLDQPTLEAVEAFSQIGLPTSAGAVLLMEQDGESHVVYEHMEQMKKICEKEGAISVEKARNESEALALTEARRSALTALARRRPTTMLEDATVPRSRLAEMVRFIESTAKKYNVEICTFGHAGDGNLHPTCMTDVRDEEEMHRVEEAFAEIFARAIELGGTITGEHGVGEMKSPYLAWKLGDAGVEAMKAIKTALDPQNIMNPGKMFAKEARKRITVGGGSSEQVQRTGSV
ncbi:FAD-binding oxidoreductase [Alteribacter natronophilus]|uniref:FAD-binding oxidoreductase n=1 Tax=Alteribacter natronophilus TaxID=2583810 RepID=UPI00110F0740|nr:FAD-linked oxidase C-terminal domain-containing protein [Alteribacter natronophilus]TMW72849.1 FAD-binding protein [Alteribacter natronophilus]